MAERQRFGCIDTWPCNCKQTPSLLSPILYKVFFFCTTWFPDPECFSRKESNSFFPRQFFEAAYIFVRPNWFAKEKEMTSRKSKKKITGLVTWFKFLYGISYHISYQFVDVNSIQSRRKRKLRCWLLSVVSTI